MKHAIWIASLGFLPSFRATSTSEVYMYRDIHDIYTRIWMIINPGSHISNRPVLSDIRKIGDEVDRLVRGLKEERDELLSLGSTVLKQLGLGSPRNVEDVASGLGGLISTPDKYPFEPERVKDIEKENVQLKTHLNNATVVLQKLGLIEDSGDTYTSLQDLAELEDVEIVERSELLAFLHEESERSKKKLENLSTLTNNALQNLGFSGVEAKGSEDFPALLSEYISKEIIGTPPEGKKNRIELKEKIDGLKKTLQSYKNSITEFLERLGYEPPSHSLLTFMDEMIKKGEIPNIQMLNETNKQVRSEALAYEKAIAEIFQSTYTMAHPKSRIQMPQVDSSKVSKIQEIILENVNSIKDSLSQQAVDLADSVKSALKTFGIDDLPGDPLELKDFLALKSQEPPFSEKLQSFVALQEEILKNNQVKEAQVRDIERLESDLSILKTEVQAMVDQKNYIEHELTELTKSKDDLSVLMNLKNELEEKLKISNGKILDIQSELIKTRESLTQQTVETGIAKSKNDQLQNEIDDYRRQSELELESLKSQIDERKIENELLQAGNSSHKDKIELITNEKINLKDEILKLKSSLHEEESKVEKLTSNLNDVNQSLVDKEVRINNLETEKSQIEEKVRELGLRNGELSQESGKLNERIKKNNDTRAQLEKELDGLRSKIQEQNSMILERESNLKDLGSRLRDQNSKMAELAERIGILENDKRRLVDEVRTMMTDKESQEKVSEQTITELNDKIKGLSEELTTRHDEIEALRRQLNAFSTEKSDLEHQLRELDEQIRKNTEEYLATNGRLAEENKDLNETIKEKDVLQSQLEKELENLKLKIQQEQEMIERHKSENEGLQIENAEYKRHIEAAGRENTRLNSEILALNNSLSKGEVEIRKLTLELNGVKELLKGNESKVGEDIQKLSLENAELVQRNKELNQKVEEVHSSEIRLKQEVEKLKSEIRNGEEKVAQGELGIEALRSEIERMRVIGGENEMISNQKIKEFSAKVKDLLEQLETKNTELETSRQNLNELLNEKSRAEEEIRKLLSENEGLSQSLGVKDNLRTQLEEKLDELEVKLRDEKNLTAQKELDIQNLKNKVEKLKNTGEEHERISDQKAEEFDTKLRELSEQLKTKEAEVEALKQELGSLSNEKLDLKRQLKELDEQIKEFEANKKQLGDEIQLVTKNNLNRIEDLELQAQTQRSQHEKEIQDKIKRIAELEEEIRHFKAEHDGLVDEITKQTHELSNLQAINKNLHDDKVNLSKDKDDMKSKVHIFQNQTKLMESHILNLEKAIKQKEDELKLLIQGESDEAALHKLISEKQDLERKLSGANDSIKRVKSILKAKPESDVEKVATDIISQVEQNAIDKEKHDKLIKHIMSSFFIEKIDSFETEIQHFGEMQQRGKQYNVLKNLFEKFIKAIQLETMPMNINMANLELVQQTMNKTIEGFNTKMEKCQIALIDAIRPPKLTFYDKRQALRKVGGPSAKLTESENVEIQGLENLGEALQIDQDKGAKPCEQEIGEWLHKFELIKRKLVPYPENWKFDKLSSRCTKELTPGIVENLEPLQLVSVEGTLKSNQISAVKEDRIIYTNPKFWTLFDGKDQEHPCSGLTNSQLESIKDHYLPCTAVRKNCGIGILCIKNMKYH